MDDHDDDVRKRQGPPKLSLVPAPEPAAPVGRDRANGFTAAKRCDFLAALRAQGQVVLAARAAGVTTQAAYQARARLPDFARGWAEALADFKPEERALRGRHDGFSADKRRLFLEGLKETGCVEDACRLAGVSDTTAYRGAGGAARPGARLGHRPRHGGEPRSASSLSSGRRWALRSRSSARARWCRSSASRPTRSCALC